MAILRPQWQPTMGSSMPVDLRQRAGMSSPQFYQQNEAVQQPTSADFIQEQLQRLRQKSATPELEPASRITEPNQELVQPSNFQTYYNRLSSINNTGQAQLNASMARSAYQRMQQAQSMMNSVGGMSSIGYKNPGYGAAGSGIQRPLTGFGAAGSATGLPSSPAANFKFAQNIAGNYGWNSPTELAAWYKLGMKESGWRNNAQNPTSTAFGIGQFLNSTWAGTGIAKTRDPALQVEAMARYIKRRYGSPSRALAFHLSHNWY